MAKLITLFSPITLTFTENTNIDPGTIIQLDTNVNDTLILWTLDGSLPINGNFGTFQQEPPVNITIFSTTRVRARAFKRTLPDLTTKTLERTYIVTRTQPAEQFKTTERFFRKMVDSIVDGNFYHKEGWVAPTSEKPLTYIFVNREPFKVRVNFLHNGIRFRETSFPILDPGASFEFPIFPVSGDNDIAIETSQVIE